MTLYNVHMDREVHLTYESIEADTAHAAAAIALDKSVGAADDIDDCAGETFVAVIDVDGDDQYERSITIEFEAERLRKAAPELLAALKACELQLREYVRWHHAHAGGCSVEIESAWEQACEAIAKATTLPTDQPERSHDHE
jgi:hypothetical protein